MRLFIIWFHKNLSVYIYIYIFSIYIHIFSPFTLTLNFMQEDNWDKYNEITSACHKILLSNHKEESFPNGSLLM